MLCGVACVRAIHRRRTDQVWQVFFDRRRAATRTRVRYTFFYFIHIHIAAQRIICIITKITLVRRQIDLTNAWKQKKKKLCVYKNI